MRKKKKKTYKKYNLISMVDQRISKRSFIVVINYL